jgi:predicted acyl esterase
VTLDHEVPVAPPIGVMGGQAPDDAKWVSTFKTWSDMDRAIEPVSLPLRTGGELSLDAPATAEASDSYTYGGPTNNTPGDFAGVSSWGNPAVPGRELTYTTPVVSHDVEFLGSGSVNLWIAAGAVDGDVQVTLSEVRPDGQEQFVENGWLRLSDRKLASQSTELDPIPTYLRADAMPLTPLVPVYARIQLLPFDHVFRTGSAIRLTIDTPGGWFAAYPAGTQMQVFHTQSMDSTLVLGRVDGGSAGAPLPSCAQLLNQPCRANSAAVPAGSIDLSGGHSQPAAAGPLRKF